MYFNQKPREGKNKLDSGSTQTITYFRIPKSDHFLIHGSRKRNRYNRASTYVFDRF